MKAVYNEAYRKPQSPALGPEIEWLKAADLIRTLPDPPME